MEDLESLLKEVSVQIFQAGGIDKPIITRRRSRMCVAVRASHRSLIWNGVVLDRSSSGATYFVEPKEAIELNNMEVRLCSSEKIEEHAILSMLTTEISPSELEIKNILNRVLEVDLAFSRAAHTRWVDVVCPVFDFPSYESLGSDDLLLYIEGIQHPLLLEKSMRQISDSVALKSLEQSLHVPVNIKVGNDIKVGMISGPNTGDIGDQRSFLYYTNKKDLLLECEGGDDVEQNKTMPSLDGTRGNDYYKQKVQSQLHLKEIEERAGF